MLSTTMQSEPQTRSRETSVVAHADTHTRPGEVTRLLRAASAGEHEAYDRVFGLVYDELRRVARYQLRGGGLDGPVRPTELVHELYLKLQGRVEADWASRAHFYAIAAKAMRQILIDTARRRNAAKRGGGWSATTLTGKQVPTEFRFDELLALDELLDGLDERQRRVIECRFYGGMAEDEIAEVLGISTRTVQREWTRARAKLYAALYPED